MVDIKKKKILQGKNNKILFQINTSYTLVLLNAYIYMFIRKQQLLYYCEAGISLGVGAGGQGLASPVLCIFRVTWEQHMPSCSTAPECLLGTLASDFSYFLQTEREGRNKTSSGNPWAVISRAKMVTIRALSFVSLMFYHKLKRSSKTRTAFSAFVCRIIF